MAVTLAPITAAPYVAAPYAAPYPADEARGIRLSGDTLKWNTASSAKSYDIYLSTDTGIVEGADVNTENVWKENTEDTSYVTGELEAGTTYYWRIDAVDGSNKKTKGDVLSFSATKSAIVTRLNGGKPLIDFSFPGVAKGSSGYNINGPSLIRIPDWVPTEEKADPSAVYYLYFAHHGGQHIRMAWAEKITGPYTMYKPGEGVSDKSATKPFTSTHIASPDVHIDNETQPIHMYNHGSGGSVVLISKWGLDFKLPAKPESRAFYTPPNRVYKDLEPMDDVLAADYMRVFEYKKDLYTITNFGRTYKSRNSDDPWNADLNGDGEKDIKNKQPLWLRGITLIEENKNKTWRHNAVRVRGDTLDVWFSTRGEKPERIRHTKIDLSVEGGHLNWAFTTPTDVLEPEVLWEGGDLPLTVSKNSSAKEVRQLRDPCYFKDIDGKEYLLYSGRGEEGIGIAIFNEHLASNDTSVQKTPTPVFSSLKLISRNGSWELSTYITQPFSVSLYDVKGEKVFQKGNLTEQRFTIPSNELQPGVYFLRYQSRAGVITKKIMLHSSN